MAKKKNPPSSPFVPAEEQPYKIPDNWCWVKLQFVSEYLKAGGDKPTVFSEERDTEHPFPVVANGIENDGIVGFTNVGPISAGTVSVSGRGTIGYSILREYEYMPVVRLIVIKPQKILLPNYLKLVFDVLDEKGTGSSIPQLTIPMIKDKFIPLSPLSEQHRIVDRIESLFAKLDEAKEKAQAVVDGFELRKSAILHKAFTGELTERWRKEHGVGIESWETKPLVEIASLQTGLMKGKRYEGETVFLPYLRVANVQDGFLDLTEIKEIEVSASNVDRYSLKRGDVLFTEGGDFDKLGRGTVWEEEIPNCLHQNHIFVVRPHEFVLNPYFLSYQAGSKYGKTYFLSCSKQTTNLASINSTQLKGFPVKLPSLSEQLQIVSTINNLIGKENHARIAAEAVLDQIDTMKKAILARAFRGELGTNDPADEWAGELVKTALLAKN